MGSVTLQRVITALNDSGLVTAPAYPGKPFPPISGPVAAVHLTQVDSSAMSATVEVLVVSPGSLGGTLCEETAMDALRVLWGLGAVCRQEGCRFDAVSGTFSVCLKATFTQTVPQEPEGEENPGQVVLPRFSVRIGTTLQPNAVSFQAQLDTGAQLEYVAAQPGAVASHAGTQTWTLRLEEQIPPATAEPANPEGEFTLTVEDGSGSWRFTGCRWQVIRREYSPQGLHRVRTGFALKREEVS